MNRYSYVLNNPLKYTDPSGYQNNSIFDIITYLLYFTENGGYYNSQTGIMQTYTSDHAATNAGIDYLNYHNGWSGASEAARNNLRGGHYVQRNVRFTSRINQAGRSLWKYSDRQGNLYKEHQYTTAWDFVADDGGGLTFGEVYNHYINGNNQPLYVELNTIDFRKVSLSDFKNGVAKINLASRKYFTNLNDALVHGTITLNLIPGTNQAEVAYDRNAGGKGGMYDFDWITMNTMEDIKKYLFRNIVTSFGGLLHGETSFINPDIISGPFPIYYTGTVEINQ